MTAFNVALKQFQAQLRQRLKELQEKTIKAADAVTTLQDRKRALKAQASNLGSAIAQMGHSATLLKQLAGVESEIEKINGQLAVANQPIDLAFSLESIRDFVAGKDINFTAAFDAEPRRRKSSPAISSGSS